MDVFLVGLWLLQKMSIPHWCQPFVLGLWGMLQDFSLDPVAVRQVFTVQGATSGRWTWLIQPDVANIHMVPVYNFPGWMLIMMYAAIYVLIGRWWFRRSGYRPAIGYMYPFIAFGLALATLVTPLSNFLLWLGPFFAKGSQAEWIMLGFHLLFPTILLAVFWRGRMRSPLTWKDDYPIFVVMIGFHLFDILAAIGGGFSEVLGLVLAASAVHIALLGWVYTLSLRMKPQGEMFLVGP